MPDTLPLNPQDKSRGDTRLLVSLALVAVLIHLLTSYGYGYFRDELYAIACSKHLAWGYVDQPPFSEFALAVVGHVLGYSPLALRLLPALCGGLVTLLVGLIARGLGGGRFAQALAATAYLAGGVYLAMASYYSMNCFDHLFWALAIYLLVRILRGGDTRLWVLFGLVAGLGVENKYSVGFLGIGLVVGLTLTPARKHLLDNWLWLGGALAALLFLPHVLWEVHNHFPTREFIHNVTAFKNLPMSPASFLLECTLQVHPLTLPIWLAGLAWLFFSPHGRTFRALGWLYLTVLAILLSTHSKPYYFAPAFLPLLAAGGVAIEAFLAQRQWKRVKRACLISLVLGGAVAAPLVLPILPLPQFVRYQAWLGFKPSTEERGAESELPELFADRLGWPEMTAQLAGLYNQLDPAERAECVVGASNYGEAGAIDFFGKSYGLPNTISTHNNYWFWGPGDKPGNVLLVIGGSKDGYLHLYEDVEQVATFTYPYARESGTPIFLCRKPTITLQEYWPHYHHFI